VEGLLQLDHADVGREVGGYSEPDGINSAATHKVSWSGAATSHGHTHCGTLSHKPVPTECQSH